MTGTHHLAWSHQNSNLLAISFLEWSCSGTCSHSAPLPFLRGRVSPPYFDKKKSGRMALTEQFRSVIGQGLDKSSPK